MSTSANDDIKQRSAADPAQNCLPALQAAHPRKNAAEEWAQGAVEKLNRMRTDEAYRREVAARAK